MGQTVGDGAVKVRTKNIGKLSFKTESQQDKDNNKVELSTPKEPFTSQPHALSQTR